MRTVNLESTELHQVINAVRREILQNIATHKDGSFEHSCLKTALDKLEKVEKA